MTKGQVFAHFKAFEAYLKTTASCRLNVKCSWRRRGNRQRASGSLRQRTHGTSQSRPGLIRIRICLPRGFPLFATGLRTGVHGGGSNRAERRPALRLLRGIGDNPIQALRVIASLHDKKCGKITIPGFYKTWLALSRTERSSFRKLPWKDRKYAASLGLKELYGEKGFTSWSVSGRAQRLNATASGVAIRVRVRKRFFRQKLMRKSRCAWFESNVSVVARLFREAH